MNKIDIVFASDDAYASPLATCIHSIGLSAEEPSIIRLYVLHFGLASESIAYLTRISNGSGMEIHFRRSPSDMANHFPISGHITPTTYLRLIAANLLEELDQFIYLDCDTLVLSDLRPIANYNLAGAHLAAVAHPALRAATFGAVRGIPTYANFGIGRDDPVFNAGVMVIDGQRWRRDQVAEQASNYLRSMFDQVRWWDQDALNVVLHRKWIQLPFRWNVMTSQFRPPYNRSAMSIDFEEYQDTISSPSIIHYTSSEKPWLPDYRGLFIEHWDHINGDRLRSYPI